MGRYLDFFLGGKIQESCDKRWFFETVGVFVSRPFLKGASTWYFNQYHFFLQNPIIHPGFIPDGLGRFLIPTSSVEMDF